jgi:hypothetical protein
MNTIAFNVVQASGHGRSISLVEPVVDGRSFKNLLAEIEGPFAAAEGSPQLAGKYEGLWVNYVAPPSRHFLGEPSHPVYTVDGKTTILDCECGQPGCWPLLCNIAATADQVVWSDFEQPHRRGRHEQRAWVYSAFGPFVFVRAEIESALATLVGWRDS